MDKNSTDKLLYYFNEIIGKRRKASFPIQSQISQIIYSHQGWEEEIVRLAQSHENVRNRKCNYTLSKYNQLAYKKLNRIRSNLAEISGDIISLVPSARWLFDNFQMMYREIKKGKTTGSTYETLPVLKSGEYAGYPRVYVLAKKMVDFSGGYLNEDNIIQMIMYYQNILPLTDKEIFSMPEMIGLSLLESIIDVSEDVMKITESKAKAERYVQERFASKENYVDISILLQEREESFEQEISFHCHVIYLLQNMSVEEEHIQRYIYVHNKSNSKFTNASEIFKEEGKLESLLESKIRTLIVSLREINQLDEENLFSSVSLLDQLLGEDPAGIYQKMDLSSRGAYRNVIEELSKKYKIEELLIGKKCIELSEEAREGLYCSNHVGTYLVGKGYPYLKSRLQGDTNKKERQAGKSLRGKGYVLISAFILLLLCSPVLLFNLEQVEGYLLALAGLVLLPIFIGIALEISNNLESRIIKIRKLPSMDYLNGVPDSARTFIVMPVIIQTKEQGVEYLSRLQKYYLANRQENLFFGLLVDFSDSKEKVNKQDKIIEKALIEYINELNDKYPAENRHFSLFIRKRKWNESENCYMGWERKRGKLEEFNALLNGEEGDKNSFRTFVYDSSFITTFKYVITIDADSNLILNNASKMVALIDHPLNHPVLDPTGKKIIEGYAIFQPSVTNHILEENSSMFPKIYGGQTGVSNYSTVVSDIYQDIFEEGIFIGKGIYNVEIFHKLMNQVVPENSVLSHDLLESCYVKTAFDSTVNIMDSFPENILSFVKREQRWIRGDWQLLPWVFKSSNISSLSRWKIIENMRRSILPINKILVILLNGIIFPKEFFLWIPIVFFSDLFSLSMLLFDIVINKVKRTKLKLVYKNLWREVAHLLEKAILDFILTPFKSYIAIDAITRTIYRLFVSKKNLLKWKSSELADKSIKNTLMSYFINMSSSFIPATALLIIIIFGNIPLGGILTYGIVLVLWLFSFLAAYFVSQPGKKASLFRELGKEEELMDVAKKTWKFFRDFSLEENHWLCPDNYQVTPKEKVTEKTSPTNIGLQLLAILSAKDLGFETLESTIISIERVMDSIEKLQKWNGHLYNWYNIKSGDIVDPGYISTVDSGNFFGHLITLKNGLLDNKGDQEGIFEERISALTNKIDQMLLQVDFGCLYNKKRLLFHIGYHVQNQMLDSGCYDLMASEASLTSFLAIAKGDIPEKHWYHLGRPMTMIKGIPAFVSWSGTMFEYLMPALVMKNYEGSVYSETSKAAVIQQIEYGKQMKIPWGISESQYFAFDLDSNYQYRAFGVPGLRLQPSLSKSLVIAPYATLLALEYSEKEAFLNLEKIRELGGYGEYGYYEAIDFNTPDPLNLRPCSIVKSFMAHHQGMILVSINNYLKDGIMRNRFHKEPVIKAVEILLEEKRQTFYVSISKKGYAINVEKEEEKEKSNGGERYVVGVTPNIPIINYLSNNQYSMMLTSDGDGFSKYKDLMLYRWRGDTYGNTGNYIYIKDIQTNRVWSSGYKPTKMEPDKYQAVFSPHQSELKREDGEISTNTTISLSLKHNLEIRKVELTNNGKTPHQIEVTSYIEVVGDSYMAEMSHPAFNKLFIESEFLEEHSIFLSRRRSDTENTNPYIMHMIGTEEKPLRKIEYENDRLNFIGRNNSLENPAAVFESTNLSNNTGFSNDPIMSLRASLNLEEGETKYIVFITGVCKTKEEAIKISDELRLSYWVDDVFEKFRHKSEMELKYLNITKRQFYVMQDIISPIFYPSRYYRGSAEMIKRNWKNQSFLWRFGVSGDNPILLVQVNSIEESGIVKNVLKVYEYMRINQIKVDLIILNEEKHGYTQPLTELLNSMTAALKIYDEDKSRPSLFMLQTYQLNPAEVDLLFTVARVVFTSKTGIYFRNIKENRNKLSVK